MNNTAFEVRKATINDTEQILKLSKQCFNLYIQNSGLKNLVSPLKETYKSVINDIQNKHVFVAEYNNEVIGSVRIEIFPDSTAYLSRFGVSPIYQKNGIGKLLMTAVDEHIQNLGVKVLYLHTTSQIFKLIKFYYENGFYIESTTKDRGYVRALLCKEYPNSSTNLKNSTNS